MQICMEIYDLEQVLKIEMAGHYGRSTCKFLRNWQLIIQNDFAVYVHTRNL